MATLPRLLTADPAERRVAFDAVRRVAGAAGDLQQEPKRRLERVEKLFDLGTPMAVSLVLEEAGIGNVGEAVALATSVNPSRPPRRRVGD